MISIFLSILLSTSAYAELLDKIVGVINEKVFTLSEVNRIQSTLDGRREISLFLFKEINSQKEIIQFLQRKYIIKDKLSSLGFVISDDRVESRIEETEKRLGIDRKSLLQLLKSKNISFNEYFEIIRDTMEFNVFNQRVIAPLVSISDQEVKNFYYKMNSQNKALSFEYQLVDFNIAANSLSNEAKLNFKSALDEYQKTGFLADEYKGLNTFDMGTVKGDDLPEELKIILRNTNEGDFSEPYNKSNLIHIFYVKKKDLTESQDFLAVKRSIYSKIYDKKSSDIIESWFDKESRSYYMLNNL